MLFDGPVSLTEAVKILLSKGIMPTGLDSDGIRQLAAALRRQSLFSAKTTNEYLLGRYRDVITSILNPQSESESESASGRARTVGYNPATGRETIRDFLRSIGYVAPEGKEGTIQDLSSDARINLMIKTNTRMAQGAGSAIRDMAPDLVDDWPAWEFLRFEDRDVPRDWDGMNGLWVESCKRAGDLAALRVYGQTQRMCALKSSGVWDEISNSDYTPGGLDQPFDPVAFGTGMGRENMSRKESEDVGLIEPGEVVAAPKLDLSTFFGSN